jgi:hypothetical protein
VLYREIFAVCSNEYIGGKTPEDFKVKIHIKYSDRCVFEA